MGKRIVILGAGFGGLRAALVLGKKVGKEHEVVLIDRNSHHTFTPLLYEVATTSKEIASYIELHRVTTYEIKDILNGVPVNFIQARVKTIDVAHGDIHLEDNKKLKYDFLVIALGSETNFFNVPGLKENSVELKSFTDALKIRDVVWGMVQEGKKEIRIVVGGGGSTGVEFAAELQNWLCDVKRNNKECDAQVAIIEASQTILNGFSQKVIKKTTKRLKRLGVNIVTNDGIAKVTQNKISLKSGRTIGFDLLVWTGGVKANSLIQSMPFKFEPKGRSAVLENMACLPENPELQIYGQVYGVGDIVCLYDIKGNPVPMVARAAISQATVAAKNIVAELKGNGQKYAYKPMSYPYIIPVGGKYAVAKIGSVVISGFLGWLLKGLVELNYLISIMPTQKALKIWLKGLKMFVQNDRLG